MAGMLDSLFGSDDTQAQNYLQNALNAYQNISVPTVAQETVGALPQETVQGTVDPNQIQAVNQAPSAFNNISLDPATRQAQMNALAGYSQIANAPGLDPEAQLALQQTINAANTQSQGAQGAIMNAAQAEGQGGGDFALTQRALAAQGASNNAANTGLNAAAMAEANKQAALGSMGQLGGQLEASDYGQAANAAAAQNAVNAANQGYANQANVGNVANQFAGQQFNVSNAQNVNAANTAANQGRVYYNAALPQQMFNNELQKAGGISGVAGQQANASQTAEQNQANMVGQGLKGATTLAATYYGGPAAGTAASGAMSNGVPVGNAAGVGPVSTPKNPNQYQPIGYSTGGSILDHYTQMLMGGVAPGEATVDGDSEKNDTVPALLSPGEIVVKRSKAANPDEAAQEAKKISLEHFSKGYRNASKAR